MLQSRYTRKNNFVNSSFRITPLPTTTTLNAISAKRKKGLDILPNEIRIELRWTIAVKVYDCVCSRDSMKKKHLKRLLYELFYGIERGRG